MKKNIFNTKVLFLFYMAFAVICGIWYSSYKTQIDAALSEKTASVIDTMKQEEAPNAIETVEEEKENEKLLIDNKAQESYNKEEAQFETTKINLNTASLEELMTLPSIGEVKANAILSYRMENGGFSSIEEILNVNGIGEKTFEKIKDSITV